MVRRIQRKVVLQVPSIFTMAKRWFFVILISIAWDAFSILLILGEDVFWKLNFVDTIYTNVSTNPGDVFTFVWITGTMLLLSVTILWNTGILGYIRDWGEANL